MIKKIWNDPVGSKVISVGIVGLISFTYLSIKSKVDGVSFAESFQSLLDLKIKVIYALGALLAYVIVRALFKRKKGSLTHKQEQLRAMDRHEDVQTGVLYRWTVWFGSDDRPFINDLEYFCTRHGGAPLRFLNGHCSVPTCENRHLNVTYHVAKNHIESILIDQWDKMQ